MTDTLRTAAQAALEALESIQGGCTDSDDGTVEAITVWCPEVIERLRAALAQPEPEPEPVQVGYLYQHDETGRTTFRGHLDLDLGPRWHPVPLYAGYPPAQPEQQAAGDKT